MVLGSQRSLGQRMSQKQTYKIGSSTKFACSIMGLSVARVLARCGLPHDFLENEGRGVDAKTWFDVIEAIAEESDDPDVALTLGRAVAKGPLHPALIAFSASPDVNTGLLRLQKFKPLIGPIRLAFTQTGEAIVIALETGSPGTLVAPVTGVLEISYFIELIRHFSGSQITPRSVTLPGSRYITDAFHSFAGCKILRGVHPSLELGTADACRPIISADTEVYRLIEAELLLRLKEPHAEAQWAKRVRTQIQSALPSGRVSIGDVCDGLRLSKRGLQRKLSQEGTSFQTILDETRASLALIYLRERRLSAEETSYLLAYQDPNSFYRAFHDWTGMTPAQARSAPLD